MDGVGIGKGDEGDAVARAHAPTLAYLRTLPSFTRLRAHGTAVGMPSDTDMGNSEVGHNVLGSGRVVDQGSKLVAHAIASGAMFRGRVWRELIDNVLSTHEPLHFIGLLSDGNVHSHIEYLLAMLHRAAEQGVKRIRIHVLLDGRDVPARSALAYIDRLEGVLHELRGKGCDAVIASGGGRMVVTMDRYGADWDMVARGWAIHVHGEGRRFPNARAAVETLYEETGRDDQNLPGFVVADGSGPTAEPVGPIRDGASVICFNFRGDRAIELTRAFETPASAFLEFERGRVPNVLYAGLMQYDGDLELPTRFLVDPPAISHTMGELLVASGRHQLAISETQKYGHVTYFWNGNRSGKFSEALERYIDIPSDRRPFHERPWMKAAEITDRLLDELATSNVDFVRVNYANGDMVGHTGDLRATIVAVEVVDLCIARIIEAVTRQRGALVVTADHGNADHMLDVGPGGTKVPRTSHSLNPVPFSVFDPRLPMRSPTLAGVDNPGLGNVAATCLELLGLMPPAQYLPSLLAPAP